MPRIDTYSNWLIKQVSYRGRASCGQFLMDLDAIEFYSVLPYDENRIDDGLALREEFSDKTDSPRAPGDEGPCSLLEMLIALARRMDYTIYEPDVGQRVGELFWRLVDNLRLEIYDSLDPYKARKRNHNKLIIDLFLNRHYNSNGSGGLFPLERTEKDQRRVELWYQMMEYINQYY